MFTDKIPRSLEDFINHIDRRLTRLELRSPHGFADASPSQVPYDELPADTRDNDIAGGAIPPQTNGQPVYVPPEAVPAHTHTDGGETFSLPPGMVLRLVWNGTAYPEKPAIPGAYFEFVGPVDPGTLYLMTKGDTWTQTNNV